MGALELGLMAAMCWGFHDVCVRFISQKTPISACIFVVLIVGLIFHICLMIPENNFSLITKTAFVYSSIAGIFFVIASFSLYYSFKRGPVRLVAPLIASYPFFLQSINFPHMFLVLMFSCRIFLSSGLHRFNKPRYMS